LFVGGWVMGAAACGHGLTVRGAQPPNSLGPIRHDQRPSGWLALDPGAWFEGQTAGNKIV